MLVVISMMAMPCHAHDTMDEPSMACMAGMSMSRFARRGKLELAWAVTGLKWGQKRECVYN